MLFTTVFSFGCSSPRWGLNAELWRLNSLCFLQQCFMYTAMQRKPALPPEIARANISAVTPWAILGKQSCGKTLTFLYLVLNWCPNPVLQWLAPTVPPAPAAEMTAPFKPCYTTSKSSLHEYTNVSCGIWGWFRTSLYLTALATGVMALTVWRWKGSCGQWPPRVHGPLFLCSVCSGLARLPTQTDQGVISDFIVEWAISYKLVFIAPWQCWRDPGVGCWSQGGGAQVS